jgi:NAD(P)-dependent dehydrogenase (short-subunit alcohol dehydrogenase family)
VGSAKEAIEVNRRAFQVARGLAPRFAESGGIFVTVQDTGGDFGLSGGAGERAWMAGLAGLTKTAGLEWSQALVKAIDLERGSRSAEELAQVLELELVSGGAEHEVGLHVDGRRTTLALTPAEAPEGEPVLSRDSVLVVSGGARGVTAATLLELARRSQPRVVLLGRTPLEEEPVACWDAADDAALKRALLEEAKAEGRTVTPSELGRQVQRILANREIYATLEALRQVGAEARYLALDVRDAAALNEALAEVRGTWGPITAVIHGAGVLADKRIADKTQEQFDLVFDTKVEGLRALLEATRNDPLAMICLFSSVAARFGNVGQCDYAMANEVLSRVAALESSRRGEACVVRTIDWGPWDGGMVTPPLRALFKEHGVPLISLEAGAQLMADELRRGGNGPVEVLVGGAPPRGIPSRSEPQAQYGPMESLSANP